MKRRIKSYKFWVGLSAALVLFLKSLGDVFAFQIDGVVIDSVVMGFCGVLIAIGIVEKPKQTTEEIDANVEDVKDGAGTNKKDD